MQEPKKRLFVAILLPEEILQNLEEAQKNFKRFARDAKWVQVHSIHLTLKFLGYVDPSKIQDIRQALAAVSQRFPPLKISVKGCGFFPNSRKPSIFWAGIESKEIVSIQQALESELANLGFEAEERTFNPHLTLARFRDPHGLMPLVEEANQFQNTTFGEFIANSFILFESILHREGAEHIFLAEYPLAS